MTAAERHAAAVGLTDARPLSEADLKRMKRTPQAKIIRRALGLSQEDFADRYRIPSVRCAIGSKAARCRIKRPRPISQ